MKTLLAMIMLSFTSLAFAGEFQLSYNDNSDNETGFGLEVALDDGEFERVLTVGENVEDMAYVVPDNATRDTVFKFRVYAFNDYAESGYTNVVETTIKERESPSLPDGLNIRYVDTVTINAENVIINPTE